MCKASAWTGCLERLATKIATLAKFELQCVTMHRIKREVLTSTQVRVRYLCTHTRWWVWWFEPSCTHTHKNGKHGECQEWSLSNVKPSQRVSAGETLLTPMLWTRAYTSRHHTHLYTHMYTHIFKSSATTHTYECKKKSSCHYINTVYYNTCTLYIHSVIPTHKHGQVRYETMK